VAKLRNMNSDRSRKILPLLGILALIVMVLTALAQGSGGSFMPVIVRGPISTGALIAKINFQPAGATIPDEYLPDTGAVYGSRGNGFTYGWNADNSATTRERNSPLAYDQRYDTLIHLQRQENPNAVWEIALLPGIYEVYVVAGDPDFYNSYLQIGVEGSLAVDGAPENDRRFLAGMATVKVQDGRLTIASGPAAENNKLLFLEIYKVGESPAPTATPTRPPGMVEFRGLWVTRFDWTVFNRPASPARIDEIVNDAADAGFNAILFQVRATADAYYTPGLEPWAQRVSGGSFGQPPSPAWDPLTYFIQQAHARGLQLHAYINVYPVGDRTPTNTCPPPPLVNPKPLYYRLQEAHGSTDDRPNGVQWLVTDQPYCGDYLYATPASTVFRNHFKAVVADIVNRYDIDGIHLDRVRYTGRSTSCDPVSEAAFGGPCFSSGGGLYEDWQRQQINTLVREVYQEIIVPAERDIWLSAAVWHTYRDYWGWGYSQGYRDYYQDSQAWVKGGYIDAIAPMIYSSNPNTFPLDRWSTLVADFQANRGDRYIIAGIGSDQQPFQEIANRIAVGRSLGTAGHALFSYTALAAHGYFDDLKNGPYAMPAAVPPISWHD
jgi:uncharacterized lipoprotein YddW (UPF0748 family)